MSVAEQLCREKELYDIHSSDDFCIVNGKWCFMSFNCQRSTILRSILPLKGLEILFTLTIESLLLQLILEGGTAIAIFVRCFADKIGIEQELEKRLYIEFPREVLATITVSIIFLTLQLYLEYKFWWGFSLTHGTITDFVGFVYCLWLGSNGTTFLLSCSSDKKGKLQLPSQD